MRQLPFSFLALLLALPVAAQQPTPDLILTHGHIFTGDSTRPWAEALAIHVERIIRVGSSEDIEKLAGPATRVIDLGGRTVTPGFNDAHIHIGFDWPGERVATDASPFPDPDRRLVGDSLGAAMKRFPGGTWLSLGIGSAILDDSLARIDWLDSIVPGHPVRLIAWTGHGSIFNTLALRALGIADSIRDPLGGWFERNSRGQLTGLAHEYAQPHWSLMDANVRTPTAAEQVTRIREQLVAAARFGLTTLQDMEATSPEVSQRVFAAADLPVRVRVMTFIHTTPTGRRLDDWVPPGRRERIGPLAYASGIKYLLDGTPIERLALMRQSYLDRPGWYGHLNFPRDTVRALLSEGLRNHTQTILHVVGDSTTALVLRLMDDLGPDATWRRERLRLEHGDGLARDLFPLARRLGVIVVANPSHLMIGPLLVARWGSNRAKFLQPMHSLLDAGIPLALGSDGPMSPFLNIMFAVTYPGNPSEALTVEQAVRAYTWGSAFAEHREGEKGMLVPGMLADLAVLSQDIFSVPVERLPATTSVLTLVGGRVVHDAGVVGKR
jgi:predicted amidohydrolase YtcJ